MKDLILKLAELLGLSGIDTKGEDLSVFTDEQLAEAETKAREAVSAAKADKDIESMKASVELVQAITADKARRVENATKLEEEIAKLEAEITPPVAEQEGEEGDEGDGSENEEGDGDESGEEGDGQQEPATPPSTETPTINVEAPEVDVDALAASLAAKLVASAPKRKPMPKPSEVKEADPGIVLTAAGDVKGHSAGTEMKATALPEAFVNKAAAFTASGKPGRAEVAQLAWMYPEERQFDYEDTPQKTTGKLSALTAAAQAATRSNLEGILAAYRAKDLPKLKKLVAAGGMCAPVGVRYDIFTVGSEVRPLRDSLLRVNANRGGLRWMPPPTLVDVDGAANIYTEAQDRAALSGSTVGSPYPKDCLRVECGNFEEEKVHAVTLCMEVGNFQRLTFPENFTAWWQLGRVWHARIAEATLWDRLAQLGLHVTDTAQAGASRAILASIARAAAQYRDRHRVDEETPLRVHIPSWVPDLMQIDRIYQAPGDDAMLTPDSEIAAYFAQFNIAVTYVMDGQPASQGGTYLQAGNAAVNQFPGHFDAFISVDGTLVFLDMGRLDFGTEIRDFTMIRNNDSGAFFETFENVINVGPDFLRLTISDVCANGQTAGPDATITCSGS